MMISKASARQTLIDHALGLCWGVWSELGVSGWARTHHQWAVDPEPLIIFTAMLGDRDPRLRDEATDWCIRYNRYISRARLRNLLRAFDEDIREPWGEFAATIGARGGVRWPAATVERPGYRVTGRSMLRGLSEPSMICLRMRALFGLGARTEILRHLLFNEPTSVTAAALATTIGYTKRIVAEECEALERAGALSVKVVGNRFYYSLARAQALRTFVGELPPIRPDWTALLRAVSVLIRLEGARDGAQGVLAVESRRAFRAIEDDLGTLGLAGPPDLGGTALTAAMEAWSTSTLADLARGRWPSDG